jgi:uncharacterized protein (TIRG00374 family)
MSRPNAPRRGLLVNLFLSALAFGLLALAVYSNRVQIRQVLSRPLDGTLLAWAFAVYFAALVLTFVRWFILVRILGIPFPFRVAVQLGFIGNVFNLVIPGAVGGDVIKAAYLYRLVPSARTKAMASMVIDRVIGLLGLFLLAGVAGAIAWRGMDADVHKLVALVWAAIVAGFVGLALVFSPGGYRWLAHRLAGRKKLARIVGELGAMGTAYREKLPVVAAMLAMAAFIHSLYVLAFYLVDRALFPSDCPTLAAHYVMVPLLLFTTAVPLPFGALGLSEQIGAQLFRLVNHPGGAVAMMGYRVLMYAGGLVSATVYLASIREVRALSQAQPPPGEEPPPALDAA